MWIISLNYRPRVTFEKETISFILDAMNTNELWQAVLGELELSLSKANFTTWFKNTFISDTEEHTITIGVPNMFTKAWLEKKYTKEILRSLQELTKNSIKQLSYRVESRPTNPQGLPLFEKGQHPEPSPSPSH